MIEHNTDQPKAFESKLPKEEAARDAFAIYQKEGNPQGHEEQNWLEAEAHLQHAGSDHPGHRDHQNHHAHMAADFRKRFWISVALTLPILLRSPMLKKAGFLAAAN